MKVSLIIPTYNRNSILINTLKNILAFSHQYHELIVIDQSKDHDFETKKYLERLASHNQIKYVYEEYPNLPNARNAGLKYASADVILFLDDDVEINENTIPNHIAGFFSPDIGCVTGKATVKNIDKSGNQVLKNTGHLKKYLKALFFFFMRRKASYVGKLGVLSNFTGNKLKYADTCIGCNMSFRKEVFDQCGLFDINYTGNAVREDTDFCCRLRKNGYKIIYNPEASIIHFMENAGGTRTAETENYWHAIFKNQCYFYIKNLNYSFLSILFIQILDIFRCKKSGCNAFTVFKKAYKDAKVLI